MVFMVLFITSLNCYSQAFKLEGNTFKSTTTSRAKRDTIVTKYYWEDSHCKKYPIIWNRSNNKGYIIKVSKKTGKWDRMYLKPEVNHKLKTLIK